MKIKPKLIKATIPSIMTFDDYHEITYVLDYLNTIFNGKMKAEELDCDGMYHAIFYLKKDKEYKALLTEWKNNFYNDEENYEY